MRIDHDERARNAKPGRKDATRNRTPSGTRANKTMNSVLSFVAALRSAGPSLCSFDPTFTSLAVSMLRTLSTRCFPVRASRRRASYPGFVGEQLETQSNGSLIVLPPVPFTYQASSFFLWPLQYLLALLRLLRLVIEEGCSSKKFCKRRNFANASWQCEIENFSLEK